MDDFVAIKIIDNNKGETGFLALGRIFGCVNPDELIEVIKPHCSAYGIRNIKSIELCWSIQDVSHMVYFYEAYWRLIQTKIPFGPKYDKWVEKMRKEMKQGKHLYFLGISKGNLTLELMDKVEPVLKRLSDS